ncbi:hypothetical protein PHMEG_00011997 [Phytophthora megakarya]|uniref:Uncharacterized protein n=1 Tax=Phytophthora megakarya TaxID=4795 RepID=A0A225WAU1_9STRA|nr:hypothetical protein PHMEG_00011997 [Phytophthora megakarya]
MLDLSGTIRHMKSGVLPASRTSPLGCTNILPTHAVIPPKRGLQSNSFVVGVPGHCLAYRAETHVQAGYGCVENLMVFDGLSDRDFNDLAKLVGSQREVREWYFSLAQIMKACLNLLTTRREMASILMQFADTRFGRDSESRLESARQAIARLEGSKRNKDFSADKLMQFLHEGGGSIREAADKPYIMAPPFPCPMQEDSEESATEDEVAFSDDDGTNAKQEGKSEDKPPVPVARSKFSDQTTTPKNKSPSAKSVSGRPTKPSHRITKEMQVIEPETLHGTVKVQSRPLVYLGPVKRALRVFSDQKWSIEQV